MGFCPYFETKGFCWSNKSVLIIEYTRTLCIIIRAYWTTRIAYKHEANLHCVVTNTNRHLFLNSLHLYSITCFFFILCYRVAKDVKHLRKLGGCRYHIAYIDGLKQDWSNPIANAVELSQYCTMSSKWPQNICNTLLTDGILYENARFYWKWFLFNKRRSFGGGVCRV